MCARVYACTGKRNPHRRSGSFTSPHSSQTHSHAHAYSPRSSGIPIPRENTHAHVYKDSYEDADDDSPPPMRTTLTHAVSVLDACVGVCMCMYVSNLSRTCCCTHTCTHSMNRLDVCMCASHTTRIYKQYSFDSSESPRRASSPRIHHAMSFEDPRPRAALSGQHRRISLSTSLPGANPPLSTSPETHAVLHHSSVPSHHSSSNLTPSVSACACACVCVGRRFPVLR